MKPKIKVHFVCRGNVYRSRMAEYYLRQQHIDSVEVTSSGIVASENAARNQVIMAARPVDLAHWIGFKSWKVDLRPAQTKQTLLDDADLIIFLSEDVARDAEQAYRIDRNKCEVWDVDDLDLQVERRHTTLGNKKVCDKLIRATHRYILKKVDILIHDISVSGMVDVVDHSDHKLDFSLPVAWVHRKGLWYRGSHVVIVTADKRVITQKRSRTIMFSPGRLDFSAGGSVSAGETYEQSACRETFEEIGIKIVPADLILLDNSASDSYNNHYRMTTRCHLRSFLVVLPERRPKITIERSEVSRVYFLKLSQIKQLVRQQHLDHIGRLATGKDYYQELVRKMDAAL